MNPLDAVIKSALKRPDGAAFFRAYSSQDGKLEEKSYLDLRQAVFALCSRFDSIPSARSGDRPVAILTQKSFLSYASVVASLCYHLPFIPINPIWPSERIKEVLRAVNPCAIVVEEETDFDREVNGTRVPVISRADLLTSGAYDLQKHRSENSLAYLIATSGTTGTPKIIPITRESVGAYLDSITKTLGIHSGDRIGQTSDLSFDVAIGDILWALSSGCSVCPISREHFPRFDSILNLLGATVMSLTPSTARSILALRHSGQSPIFTIRLSTFIGEPLSVSLCRQWLSLAPHTSICNLYGPAEATISVTSHRVVDLDLCSDASSTIPIGALNPGHEFKIEGGIRGELLIRGPQVFNGYWNQTKGASNSSWYATGDIVEESPKGELRFVGRVDNQVKIAGQRVELEELEGQFERALGFQVVFLPWAPTESFGYSGTIMLVPQVLSHVQIEDAIKQVSRFIAEPLLPRAAFQLASWPINSSGKADRKRIIEQYKSADCKVIWGGL